MGKVFTIFLTASPTSRDTVLTAARIAESAVNKGHRVNLIASGDGINCLLKEQKAGGAPDAGDIFTALITKGLKGYLCEASMNDRRAVADDYIDGMEAASLKNIYEKMAETDVWINL